MRTWSAVLGIPVFLVVMLAIIAHSGAAAQSLPEGPPGVTVTPEVRPVPSPEPTAVPPNPTPTPVPRGGSSGASGARSSTSPPAFNITYTYGDGVINLDWDDIPGAMGYDIYQWDGGTGWNRLPFTDGTERTFTVTLDGSSATLENMVNGVGYSQYVVTKNVNGHGDVWSATWIETKIVVLEPPVPTNLRIVSTTTDHQVTVAWDAIEDIADYRVEAIWVESTSSVWLAYGHIVTSTQVSFAPLWCNSSFHFAVSPRGDGFPYRAAFSSHSVVLYDTPYCPPSPPPSSLRTSPGRNSINVNWNAVSDSVGYGVWAKVLPGNDWFWVNLVADSTAVVDNLVCGRHHEIAVQSFGSGIEYRVDGGDYSYVTSYSLPCPEALAAPSELRVVSTSTDRVGSGVECG